MEQLAQSDLRRLVDVISSVVRLETLDDYREGVVGELRRLMPGDAYGYNEIELDGAPAFYLLHPPDAAVDRGEEHLGRFASQNPLIVRGAAGETGAIKWSDFISRAELHRTDIYDLLYEPQGTEAQIACTLPANPSRLIGLAVNRARGDFSERDRAMLDLARPAFVQAYRAAIDRALLHALLDAPVSPGASPPGVILLSRQATIERATPAAERWLRRQPDCDGPNGIPRGITGWVEEHRRRRTAGRIRLPDDEGTLSVSFVPGAGRSLDALVIEWSVPRLRPEGRSRLGLTKREFEVLQLVERGRSNAQIALELGVKEDTVAKHLSHVYEKLGVSSRTEAVHRAAELAANG